MTRPRTILAATAVAFSATIAISGCASFGTSGIKLAKSNPDYAGAVIFRNHCAGCHTLSIVGAEGAATSIQDRVRTDAPNFDVRRETVAQVLYALHNGGFSGEVMPQNIVVGKQAAEVAAFLSKYAGREKPKTLGESEAIEAGGASTGTGSTASSSSTASSTASSSSTTSSTTGSAASTPPAGGTPAPPAGTPAPPAGTPAPPAGTASKSKK
ncbi:MAG: c-type cytochrome [Solirubrobacteraceae bacterium]